MAVERLTPERRRAMTRDHLLAAAAEVFAQRGYHGATLDDVAETAGFTKGAVYSNFSSKEDLFLALSQRREEQLINAFAAAARPDLEPVDLIASLRDVYAGSDPDERERSWRLWQEFTLFAMRNPDARQKLAEDQRAGFTMVVDLVERQCARANIKPPIPVDLIARIYIALFNGLWAQQALDPDAVDDDTFPAALVFVGQAIEALGTPVPVKKRARRAATRSR